MTLPPTCIANLNAQPEGHKSLPWGRLADLSALGVWLTVVSITLSHHEKWADEAQAWLLARDLDLQTLWFRELRYEGCPGLWHSILWAAQHIFHMPYAALGAIGAVFAMAGVALMLFKAPFPRPVRWLLTFSYYMVYQYAVVARPYTMFPLLAFAAALCFKDRRHPERITIALILLSNVNAHGALLAACIGLAYLIEAIPAWSSFDEPVRRRFVLSIGAMLLTFLFLFVVLKPPPDVEALQVAQQRTLAQGASKAFQGISGAFFDSHVLALAWLALVAAWCWLRKKLIVFLLPVVILGIFYGVVNGWVHQQGTIFVAAITGLWIAWPTAQEEATFLPRERHAYFTVIALLVCLLGYETWNAAVVIRNDYRYPYCGAEDTARYLKSVGADSRPIVGYLYAMVAVQAYFDQNIQANLPTAYAHHGLPLLGVRLDPVELNRLAPDYVVFPCWEKCESTFRKVYEPFMRDEGYSLVHASDGYLFWKRGWDLRQIYFVFRRN
jgi:hypothetical protein